MKKVLCLTALLFCASSALAAPVATNVALCNTAEDAEVYTKSVAIKGVPFRIALEQMEGSCKIEFVRFEPGETVKTFDHAGLRYSIIKVHTSQKMVQDPSGAPMAVPFEGDFYATKFEKMPGEAI